MGTAGFAGNSAASGWAGLTHRAAFRNLMGPWSKCLVLSCPCQGRPKFLRKTCLWCFSHRSVPFLALREFLLFSVNPNRARASLCGSCQHFNIRLWKQPAENLLCYHQNQGNVADTSPALLHPFCFTINLLSLLRWGVHGPCIGHLSTGTVNHRSQWGEISSRVLPNKTQVRGLRPPRGAPPPYGIGIGPQHPPARPLVCSFPSSAERQETSGSHTSHASHPFGCIHVLLADSEAWS